MSTQFSIMNQEQEIASYLHDIWISLGIDCVEECLLPGYVCKIVKEKGPEFIKGYTDPSDLATLINKFSDLFKFKGDMIHVLKQTAAVETISSKKALDEDEIEKMVLAYFKECLKNEEAIKLYDLLHGYLARMTIKLGHKNVGNFTRPSAIRGLIMKHHEVFNVDKNQEVTLVDPRRSVGRSPEKTVPAVFRSPSPEDTIGEKEIVSLFTEIVRRRSVITMRQLSGCGSFLVEKFGRSKVGNYFTRPSVIENIVRKHPHIFTVDKNGDIRLVDRSALISKSNANVKTVKSDSVEKPSTEKFKGEEIVLQVFKYWLDTHGKLPMKHIVSTLTGISFRNNVGTLNDEGVVQIICGHPELFKLEDGYVMYSNVEKSDLDKTIRSPIATETSFENTVSQQWEESAEQGIKISDVKGIENSKSSNNVAELERNDFSKIDAAGYRQNSTAKPCKSVTSYTTNITFKGKGKILRVGDNTGIIIAQRAPGESIAVNFKITDVPVKKSSGDLHTWLKPNDVVKLEARHRKNQWWIATFVDKDDDGQDQEKQLKTKIPGQMKSLPTQNSSTKIIQSGGVPDVVKSTIAQISQNGREAENLESTTSRQSAPPKAEFVGGTPVNSKDQSKVSDVSQFESGNSNKRCESATEEKKSASPTMQLENISNPLVKKKSEISTAKETAEFKECPLASTESVVLKDATCKESCWPRPTKINNSISSRKEIPSKTRSNFEEVFPHHDLSRSEQVTAVRTGFFKVPENANPDSTFVTARNVFERKEKPDIQRTIDGKLMKNLQLPGTRSHSRIRPTLFEEVEGLKLSELEKIHRELYTRMCALQYSIYLYKARLPPTIATASTQTVACGGPSMLYSIGMLSVALFFVAFIILIITMC